MSGTSVVWATATSGDWSQAADWGGTVPSAADAVSITAAGVYTIGVSATAAALSLELDDTGALITVAGDLSISAALGIDAGTVEMFAAPQAGDPPGSMAVGSITGAADGMLIVDTGATLTVTEPGLIDGISLLLGAATLLFAPAGSTAATLTFGPNLALDGSGTIAAAAGDAILLAGPLTTGLLALAYSNILTLEAGTVTNTGTIDGNVAIDAASFVNDGLISATGGALAFLVPSIAGSGTIRASDTTITLGAPAGTALTAASLLAAAGSITGTANTLLLTGTIDNQGGIFANGTGTFVGAPGGAVTIEGGIIASLSIETLAGPIPTVALDGVTLAGAITLPGASAATLLIDGGLALDGGIGGGAATLAANGPLTAVSGGSIDGGTITKGDILLANESSTAATLTLGAGLVIDEQVGSLTNATRIAGDLIVNRGMITATDYNVCGGSIIDDGTIAILPQGYFFDEASTYVEDGLLEATSASLVFTEALRGSGTISLTASTLVLYQGAAFTGTIAGFTVGDTIVLEGLAAPATATATIEPDGEAVITAGTQAIALTLAAVGAGGFGSAGLGGASLAIDNNAEGAIEISLVPCFAAGTRILTTRGEIPVESIATGEVLITADGSDGRVVWAGSRTLDLARHPHPDLIRPIRIRAGAFGADRPSRDLRVSPDHALWFPAPGVFDPARDGLSAKGLSGGGLAGGCLVEAKNLVDGAGIVADGAARRVTYHHLELARHTVIFAEGTAAESYLDTGNRAIFEHAPTLVLHPDLSNAARHAASVAPIVDRGPVLAAIRAMLHAEALAHGFRLQAAPPHLVAGGHVIPPLAAGTALFAYTLPRRVRAATLVSTPFVPAETDPASTDRRRLGAGLAMIRLDGVSATLGDLTADTLPRGPGEDVIYLRPTARLVFKRPVRRLLLGLATLPRVWAPAVASWAPPVASWTPAVASHGAFG